MDADSDGGVGAAIGISKDCMVVDHGGKGDSALAWVRILTSVGELNIASVHAPNEISGTGWRKTWRIQSGYCVETGIWWSYGMIRLATVHSSMGMKNVPGTDSWLNGTWLITTSVQGIGKDPSSLDKLRSWIDWTNLDWTEATAVVETTGVHS